MRCPKRPINWETRTKRGQEFEERYLATLHRQVKQDNGLTNLQMCPELAPSLYWSLSCHAQPRPVTSAMPDHMIGKGQMSLDATLRFAGIGKSDIINRSKSIARNDPKTAQSLRINRRDGKLRRF
jgi:hypothetical protein